jgi:hypothetical protein
MLALAPPACQYISGFDRVLAMTVQFFAAGNRSGFE